MEYNWEPFRGGDPGSDKGLEALVRLIQLHRGRPFSESDVMLIAGCGDGREAFYFNRHLGCAVVGIDQGLRADYESGGVAIRRGDIMTHELADDSLACAVSYHVIEHVGDPSLFLKRLASALRKGEILLIGFPNKARVFGYLGSGQATAWQKVKWNIKDWLDRLMGRFENELGAHAGFRSEEFAAMCRGDFSEVKPVTNDYMRLKYGSQSGVVRMLIWSGLARVAFPSCYFVLRK